MEKWHPEGTDAAAFRAHAEGVTDEQLIEGQQNPRGGITYSHLLGAELARGPLADEVIEAWAGTIDRCGYHPEWGDEVQAAQRRLQERASERVERHRPTPAYDPADEDPDRPAPGVQDDWA